jgi:hypothetical protein
VSSIGEGVGSGADKALAVSVKVSPRSEREQARVLRTSVRVSAQGGVVSKDLARVLVRESRDWAKALVRESKAPGKASARALRRLARVSEQE